MFQHKIQPVAGRIIYEYDDNYGQTIHHSGAPLARQRVWDGF
jgi:hypothetical protein